MDQLRDLLVDDLQDLLSAETQLVAALPKMAEAANNPKLKEAFEKHLQQTEVHVERLKKAFEFLGEKAQAKTCKGMKGLIEEGQAVIEENEDAEEFASDLALIAAAQKVEHYEIASYGTVRAWAEQMGHSEAVQLLQETIEEEKAANEKLTEIAENFANQASA